MSQDLIKISPDDFELQLPKISVATLKDLIRRISELTTGNIASSLLMNLTRKETKIWRELMRRGYMATKDYAEFFKWRNGLYKKRLFGKGIKI